MWINLTFIFNNFCIFTKLFFSLIAYLLIRDFLDLPPMSIKILDFEILSRSFCFLNLDVIHRISKWMDQQPYHLLYLYLLKLFQFPNYSKIWVSWDHFFWLNLINPNLSRSMKIIIRYQASSLIPLFPQNLEFNLI